MVKEDILLDFEGALRFETINDLLNQLKFKLNDLEIEMPVRRRVYSVMVECLENIYRHNESRKFENKTGHATSHQPRFHISGAGNKFLLYFANLVSKTDKENIIYRVDLLNRLNKREINQLYKEKIANTSISEKGGAGLGLIEIAKNSLSALHYSFTPVSNDFWYFELEVTVSKKKT